MSQWANIDAKKKLVGFREDDANVNLGREDGVAVWVPRETPAPWLVVIHSVSHRFELAVKDTFKGTGADASGNCARPTEPDGCSTRELLSSGERHTDLL